MRKISSNFIGIDQGEEALFSDFEDGGDMWTGEGERERRQTVLFSEPFRTPPSVTCGLSLWDVDYSTSVRSDLSTENVTRKSFDIVFRTWGNTRIARARVNWLAIGELDDEDNWDVE